jgi:hypothetical protein
MCGVAGYSTRSRMPKPSARATLSPAEPSALKSSSALIIFIAPETTVLYCMRW